MTSYQNKPLEEAVSREDLVEGFRRIGIKKGMTVEVHTSMKKFGYVIGGSQTVVDALLEAVGYDGTIVMPLQSSGNTEPSYWVNPPAERYLWNKIRSSMPPFDPDASEFAYMGQVPNNLNRRPGAYRSNHPSCAFVTYGKYGKLIAHTHDLDFALGENSPLGTMYGLPSYILLAGVGYDNCTAMHLGEYRSNARPIVLQGSAVEENGYRHWEKYLDLDLDSDEFKEIGEKFEAAGKVTVGNVGAAECRFMKFSEIVDFTAEYLKKKYSVEQ